MITKFYISTPICFFPLYPYHLDDNLPIPPNIWMHKFVIDSLFVGVL